MPLLLPLLHMNPIYMYHSFHIPINLLSHLLSLKSIFKIFITFFPEPPENTSWHFKSSDISFKRGPLLLRPLHAKRSGLFKAGGLIGFHYFLIPYEKAYFV